MAIAKGSIVMIKGVAGNELVGGDPAQGVVYVYSDPNCDVLWSGGPISSEDIDKVLLSEIEAAAAGTQALIGKRVRIAGQNAALDITVSRAYSRDDVDKVLGKTADGTWRELVAANVTVVP